MAEEDVDKWSYEKAGKWLQDNKFNYDDLESLEEMLQLIKAKMATMHPGNDETGQPDDLHGQSAASNTESQRMMQSILTKDQNMKEELSEMYLTLLDLVRKKLDEESKALLSSLYEDYEASMLSYNSELVNGECPIVVAGEVSAGKSSFLNLLLGADVLPHSLLCATSTVCCLHKSEKKWFEVTAGDSRERVEIQDDAKAMEELQKQLKKYVSVSSEDNRQTQKYKQVDIYWPIPMLPARVTIVDTPGVGESDEMTRRLMSFLPRAVAFIYIINSSIAGGIQEDKLVKILKEQTKWELEGRLATFDSESTIFVCNKWDIVEERGEQEKVWDFTVSKLKSIQPNISEGCIFKMSTSEAARYVKSGMGYTEKFQKLLSGLERLMPRTLRAKVDRHYRWIDKFLSSLQGHVSSRINNARKSEEEKKKLKDEVLARLGKLRIESNRVKLELMETARQRCLELVNQLHVFVHTNMVTERLLQWNDADAPDIAVGDFEVTKLEADKKIMTRIKQVLSDWEKQSNLMQTTSAELTAMFKEKCSLLDEQCKEVDLMIEGDSTDPSLLTAASSEKQKKEATVFSTREKVILGVAAPLWIPLVLAAGVIFLPVGIGVIIGENIKAAHQRKEYKKNKARFMKEWTQKVMEVAFTKENIDKFIMETYFSKYQDKISLLCSEFIPKMIDKDEKLVNFIVNDVRSSQQIIDAFSPLLVTLRKILWKFKTYKLTYVSSDLMDVKEIHLQTPLGSGSFAEVFKASWKQREIAVKVMKEPLENDKILPQLEEVDCLRELDHPNVVKFLGVTYNSTGRSQSGEDGEEEKEEELSKSYNKVADCRLWLLFELCERTLKELVFSKPTLQCWKFKSVPDREGAFRFYVCKAIDICRGLQYIHDQKFIHRDLKLSNVLMKCGQAKICDMGSARLEELATTTFAGTISHMSPEMLDSLRYSSSTDIYSLGILLWEMWYAKQAYSDDIYTLPYRQLISMIATGMRPKLNVKFQMLPDLEALVTSSWNEDPSKRPLARVVAVELKKLYTKHYQKEMPPGY